MIKAILGEMKIDLRRGGNFPFLWTTEAGARVVVNMQALKQVAPRSLEDAASE